MFDTTKHPNQELTMEYDEEKVSEIVLALLHLTKHGDKHAVRAWKSMDWDAMDRLYDNGYISDPKNKAKSVLFTEKGLIESEKLFNKHFAKS